MMLIRIGYEMLFDLPRAVAFQLMLRLHPTRQGDLHWEKRAIESNGEPLPVQEYSDVFGNCCERILAPAGRLRLWADGVIKDSGTLDAAEAAANECPVGQLPPEVMPYLLASRYCEVDKLSPIAWELFGSTPPGWARVQAICDWVNAKIMFGYHHARWTKSALDVYLERGGVCRDFTHLAIALCRGINIPARYVSGYLGDIGVPVSRSPMDFSGWFEVFLDGQWWTFDARHNQRRIGRIVMTTGRDAADVALTTSFGPAPLAGFQVWTDEIKDEAEIERLQKAGS